MKIAKSILSLALVLVLITGLVPTASAGAVDGFKDISEFMPKYESALRYIVEQVEVMGGSSSTTFDPDEALKRCDMIVTLCRVFNVNVSAYSSYSIPFNDVPSTEYYTNAVKWAYHNGIISGTTPTTFSPNSPVTREALCLVFDRYCTKFSIYLSNNGSTFTFSDDSSIDSLYKNSVYKLFRAGIVTADEGKFYPKSSMLRMYFAMFLFRYYKPTLPATPSLTVGNVYSNSITVRWPSVVCDGYQVRINNGSWINVSTTTSSIRAYACTNLNANTSYVISVRSVKNYSKTKLYSDPVTATVRTKHKYKATVNNYYDAGYFVYYDESQATSQANINNYIKAIANRYMQLFDLELSYNGASRLYTTIDNCKVNTYENLDRLCPHAEKHTVLFNRSGESYKALSNFFNSNVSPAGSSTLTNAYWSGHKIQTYANLEEFNRSYSSGSSIYILERSKADNRYTDSTGILMHELNHQYGAPDHYHEIVSSSLPSSCKRSKSNGGSGYCSKSECNIKNGTINRPSTCIMNESRQDISKSTIICQGCKSDMITHLENHHKQ